MLQDFFSQNATSLSVHDQFYHLRQRGSTVTDYALQFRTLTAAGYRQGQAPELCLWIAFYDDSMGLENTIQHSIQVAQCLPANIITTASSPCLFAGWTSITYHRTNTAWVLPSSNRIACVTWIAYIFTLVERVIFCLPVPYDHFIHISPEITNLNHIPIMVSTTCLPVSATARFGAGSPGSFISTDLLFQL